jgi:hypothetical protein
MIVDGSVPSNEHRHSIHGDPSEQYMALSHSTSTSDDHAYDTPATTSDILFQDLQDHSSYDSDYNGLYGRHNHESSMHAQVNGVDSIGATNGSSVNDHSAKLGSLHGRLQNLQVSNPDQPQDPSAEATRGSFQFSNSFHPLPDHDVSESGFSGQSAKSMQPPSSIAALFPAKEGCTPSPTAMRRPNGVDTQRMNGTANKTKAQGRQEALTPSSPATTETKERHPESLPRKPNGFPPLMGAGGNDPVNTNPSGGWQTTKKKHKKGAKSAAGLGQATVNGAEPLPIDESMRKGG